jgi:hypothetical protein
VPVSTPVGHESDDPEAAESEDRPTIVPKFDVEEFARDSEVRQRVTPAAHEGGSSIERARRLYEDGQPEEALFVLAGLVQAVPFDEEARALSSECRVALEKDCLAAIGDLSAVLHVGVPPDMLRGLGLDHVSGFLLSRIDGLTDVESLLDVSGLPRLLALRHLRGLVTRGVVVSKRAR